MITNLKLHGTYNIGLNSSNQINVNGTAVSKKEIPFVRYAFPFYGEKEVKYIKETMEKFSLSTHLVEIHTEEQKTFMNLPDGVGEQIDKKSEVLSSINVLKDLIGKVAIYIYVSLDDTDSANKKLADSKIDILRTAMMLTSFDKIMLIDNTTCIGMATAKEIIKNTSKELGVGDIVGLCSSPLCMGVDDSKYACLPAVQARALAAKYNTNTDVTLPSANHQDMSTCSCIRHYTVATDIAAPEDTKKKTSTKSKKEKTPKEKVTKEPKVKNTPKRVLSLEEFI